MKSIAESMHNFDRENFQRVAAGLPEMQDEQAVKRHAAKTAEIFNELFRQLLAVFPALASKTPEEMNEMRRQWLLAFKENGIVSMEQINAGMRVARKQERPFMPSPGQFVAWCKSNQPYLPGYLMQWNWSIWFTSTAGPAGNTRMLSPIRGQSTTSRR